MAKNFHTDNKAFMLYKDWEDIFQALDSSEEIGELVMALFAYAKRGETPKLSGGTKIAFLMMRAAIERDGIAWEEMCAQRSECGKKGGRPKKSDESGNTDEKAEQTAASVDNAEEKPQGINDTAEKPKAFSQTKRFSEKAKKADKVFLATDPDREGEAISWHLAAALKLDDKKMRRITFNEITKNAVKASLKAPREIDMDLVDAQQARRALDRMVGYKISPLLWAKVKRGLSAGRVQSVALRIIADREDEINAFLEGFQSVGAVIDVAGQSKSGHSKNLQIKCQKVLTKK